MSDETTTDVREAPEPPPRPRVRCPGCGSRAFQSDGWTQCGSCTASFRIVAFAPLLDAPEMAAGDGRCANHPGKDAASACARCGAFACDVCVTRTGEDVLCPECFTLLHERGQLKTTHTGRTRWDYVTLGIAVAGLVIGCLASPVSLALSAWLLYQARNDRWIRVSYVVAALVLSVLEIGVLVAAFAAGALS